MVAYWWYVNFSRLLGDTKMNDIDKLQELLLLQTNITTIILAFTAVILLGLTLDILLHLYKKYIKKGKKDEKTL